MWLIEYNGTGETTMFNADHGTAGNRWNLLRIQPGHKITFTLLSERFFTLTTHYARVTVPCSGDGCRLCELLPSRGVFYLAGMVDGIRAIVELSAMSAMELEQHLTLLHGGFVVGHRISVTRRGKRTPVRSEVIETLPSVNAVPMITLASRVMAIYKCPCAKPGETLEQYGERLSALCAIRNMHLADSFLKTLRTAASGV